MALEVTETGRPQPIEDFGTSGLAFAGPAVGDLRETGQDSNIQVPTLPGEDLKHGLNQLSGTDYAKASEIIRTLGTDGVTREAFLSLLNQKLDGASALLSKDKDGATLLDNLHTVINAENFSDPKLASRKGELLSSLIQEVANSGNINQGVYATCVLTAGLHRLAEDRPAEYARMVVELATKGKSELGAGENIYFDRTALERTNGRTLSESLAQTSLLGFVKGYEQGLTATQAEIFYEKLFNEPFKRMDNGYESREAILSEIVASNGKNMASIRYGSGAHVYHAIEVGDIKDGRVYFYNPHGAEYKTYGNIGARLEDEGKALYSMTVDEFMGRLNYVIVKDNDPNAKFGTTPERGHTITKIFGERMPVVMGPEAAVGKIYDNSVEARKSGIPQAISPTKIDQNKDRGLDNGNSGHRKKDDTSLNPDAPPDSRPREKTKRDDE